MVQTSSDVISLYSPNVVSEESLPKDSLESYPPFFLLAKSFTGVQLSASFPMVNVILLTGTEFIMRHAQDFTNRCCDVRESTMLYLCDAWSDMLYLYEVWSDGQRCRDNAYPANTMYITKQTRCYYRQRCLGHMTLLMGGWWLSMKYESHQCRGTGRKIFWSKNRLQQS